MIVKSAMLVKSPFDSNYINVPDTYTNNEGNIIYWLKRYFNDYCEPTVVKVGENFPQGYAIPLNQTTDFTVTFAYNELYDKIANYNYVIFSSVDNISTDEIDDFNAIGYFISNYKINNSKMTFSVTFECQKDAWTYNYNKIMSGHAQNIIRKHYYPFKKDGTIETDFYTNVNFNDFVYSQKLTPDKSYLKYQILYLRLLLDNSRDYGYSTVDYNKPQPIQNFPELNINNIYAFSNKIDLGRGVFQEISIPIEIYYLNGGICNEIRKFSFFENVEHPDDLQTFGMHNVQAFISSPYVVGAYFTFDSSITYYENVIDGVEYIVFDGNGGYIYAAINVDGKEYFDLADKAWYPLKISAICDYISVALPYKLFTLNAYEIEPDYYTHNVLDGDEEFYEEVADIEELKKFNPDYNFIKLLPHLKYGNLDKRLVGKGYTSVDIREVVTQFGKVSNLNIYFNNALFESGDISKIVVQPTGFLPLVKDQYTQYMMANSNSRSAELISSGYDLLSRSINTIYSGIDNQTAYAYGDSDGVIKTSRNITNNVIDTRSARVKRDYLITGAINDLKNRVSSISDISTSGYDSLMFYDRPFFYFEEILDNDSTLSFVYDTHINGSNLNEIGKVKENCRLLFDYIEVNGYKNSLITNKSDKEIISQIFERGVRKVHIDNLHSSYINLMSKNCGSLRRIG